jgi:hypothetical protein
MSDERKPLRLIEPMNPDEEPRGCFALWGALGLAGYAVLLMGFICMGLIGVGGSTVAMLLSQASSGAALASGVEVDSWRLSELRGVGILEADVTPSVYHDHSPKADGSAGCMVAGDELVSWEGWANPKRVTIAGAALRQEGPEDAPTVTLSAGGVEVACPFGRDQGGDKFARMLNAEIRRASEP